MALRLITTHSCFKLEDESGYSFTVVTERDPVRGWSASVTVDGRGMATEQAAIERARQAAMRFCEMAMVCGPPVSR